MQISRPVLCTLSAIGLLCGPTQGLAAEDPLPSNLSCKVKSQRDASEDYYPQTAQRLEQQGRVLVEVQLDKDGSLINPVIVSSDQDKDSSKRLEQAAVRIVGVLRCQAKGPSVLGESAKDTFRLSFVFEFKPGGVLQPYPVSDLQLDVTATRLPRPPSNNPLQRSESQ